jgi:plasmid stabilization system protein ParE
LSFFVRIRERARRDLAQGFDHQVKWNGYKIADEWDEGFIDALGTLSENPRSCPPCPELENRRQEFRQLWYRRTPDATPWRAIFTIDDTENLVDVLHLRHGARRPLTRKEQREIATEAGEQP